jgi:hypothetical protein
MRKAAIASGVVGLVLLVAAALLAFWITPSYIARLPSSYNKVRTYNGTIGTLVNPAALATGNLAAAVKTGLPATIRMQVQVQQTSGNTALVRDSDTISTSGRAIGAITSHYALDRKTLMATTSHPSNWNVVNAKGLTVSWPIGAMKQNYTGWVAQTQTTTQLKYVKQANKGGVNTYVYQATVPTTPIKNAQVLSALPKSLPVALLPRISAAGLISASQLAGLAKAFPHATQIPLGYTYQATSTYWVAPSTGIIVDISSAEREMGGIAMPNGTIIPLIPVLVDTYQASPSSLQAAATDANNGSSTITTWGTIVPIVAAVVGFLLVVLAVIFWRRGSGRQAAVADVGGGPTASGHRHDQAA